MSPSPEALQQRYSSIEQVYAEQNWPEVDRQSQQLLADLPDDPRDPLRQRLVLLLAHTRLYGSGDAEAASQFYGAVAAADPEPALLEIAQQGLAQCEALRPPGPEPVVAETAAAESSQPAAAPAATPWLQELGDGGAAQPQSTVVAQQLAPFQRTEPLPVEVVEEPEQIEVALANREGLELVSLEAKPAELQEPSPPGRVSSAEPAPLPVGFSPEELQELSRGLLRAEFS